MELCRLIWLSPDWGVWTAATTPASRHSRAADVVEECMVTLKRDRSQDVDAAGINVSSFKQDKKIRDVRIGGKRVRCRRIWCHYWLICHEAAGGSILCFFVLFISLQSFRFILWLFGKFSLGRMQSSRGSQPFGTWGAHFFSVINLFFLLRIQICTNTHDWNHCDNDSDINKIKLK